MTGASEVAARRVRRASTRRARFWLAIDRRVIAGAIGVVLLIGGLVFLAGIGVGKALAPLVPEEPQPALVRPPAPERPKVPALVGAPTSAPTPALAPTPASAPTPAPVLPAAAPAPVKAAATVAAVETAPPPVAPLRILREAPRSGYGLQLGAFETEAQAVAFVTAHQEALAPVAIHVLASEIPKKGTWYRVRVGLYKEKAAAQRALLRLGPELEKSAIVVSYR